MRSMVDVALEIEDVMRVMKKKKKKKSREYDASVVGEEGWKGRS